jgi:hypothetical protein
MMLITVSSSMMVNALLWGAGVTVGFMVLSFPDAYSWIFDSMAFSISRRH